MLFKQDNMVCHIGLMDSFFYLNQPVINYFNNQLIVNSVKN